MLKVKDGVRGMRGKGRGVGFRAQATKNFNANRSKEPLYALKLSSWEGLM